MKNTLLIIGRSPILDTYVGHINYLTEIYPSIGINSVSTVVNTMYSAFLDDAFKYFIGNISNKNHLIIPTRFMPLSELYECSFYDTFVPRKRDGTLNLVKNDNGELAYFGFTHDYCISWAIEKNFDNVVLFGAADFCTDAYASTGGNTRTPTFKPNINVEEESINAIENFYSKRINIFTINENSKLKVPRITIDELYNRG